MLTPVCKGANPPIGKCCSVTARKLASFMLDPRKLFVSFSLAVFSCSVSISLFAAAKLFLMIEKLSRNP